MRRDPRRWRAARHRARRRRPCGAACATGASSRARRARCGSASRRFMDPPARRAARRSRASGVPSMRSGGTSSGRPPGRGRVASSSSPLRGTAKPCCASRSWNHATSGSACSKAALRGARPRSRPATRSGRRPRGASTGTSGPGSTLRCGAMSLCPTMRSGRISWRCTMSLHQLRSPRPSAPCGYSAQRPVSGEPSIIAAVHDLDADRVRVQLRVALPGAHARVLGAPALVDQPVDRRADCRAPGSGC